MICTNCEQPAQERRINGELIPVCEQATHIPTAMGEDMLCIRCNSFYCDCPVTHFVLAYPEAEAAGWIEAKRRWNI